MRSLGWRRANTAGTVKINRKDVAGWVKGEQPWFAWAVGDDATTLGPAEAG
jgi:hypothetical protein